jgi:hypothetical protein
MTHSSASADAVPPSGVPSNVATMHPSAPAYRLFDPTSVFIAAIFGTTAAGAALMALNYMRSGRKDRTLATLIVGVLVTCLEIAAGYLFRWDMIPTSVALVIPIAFAVATRQVAQVLQGGVLQEHAQAGGKLASRWAAVGLGLAFLAAIYAGIVAVLLMTDSKIVVGAHDKVHFSGPATQPEALALGDALKAIGYFRDQGVDVFLSKEKGTPIVSLVVKEGAWNQGKIVGEFERAGMLIALRIGFPLTVRLVDDDQRPKKDIGLGRIIIGTKDSIYYLGSATESDAKALGAVLQSAEYLRDRGVSVVLSKDDDGTGISFPVNEGSWDKQEIVDYFVALARRSAPSVGGVPIDLRLLNSNLEIKKVLLISEAPVQ